MLQPPRWMQSGLTPPIAADDSDSLCGDGVGYGCASLPLRRPPTAKGGAVVDGPAAAADAVRAALISPPSGPREGRYSQPRRRHGVGARVRVAAASALACGVGGAGSATATTHDRWVRRWARGGRVVAVAASYPATRVVHGPVHSRGECGTGGAARPGQEAGGAIVCFRGMPHRGLVSMGPEHPIERGPRYSLDADLDEKRAR